MALILASALVLAACLLGFLSRRRSSRIQSCARIAALAALSSALWNAGERPLLLSAAPVTTIAHRWLRALAIGRWLFAYRAAISLLRVIVGHGRHSRETRLFSDLLAAGNRLHGAPLRHADSSRLQAKRT